jgi:hypothetical protein
VLELVVMLVAVVRSKDFVVPIGFEELAVNMLVFVKLMIVDLTVVVILVYLNQQNLLQIVYS